MNDASNQSQSKLALGMSEISTLLKSLELAAANSGHPIREIDRDQFEVAQERLGVASSLFTALRCKHPPSAAHSIRVALGVSAWAGLLGIDNRQRDQLEVAGLLHDLGKIGVPDHILQKAGSLTHDEAGAMAQHSVIGAEILAAGSAPDSVLQAVRYAPAWYDGSREPSDLTGQDIPLGARLISIVDAFDSMTTDQIFRRAMSRERALFELFEHSGTQFDPQLVTSFRELHENNQVDLNAAVSQRWLETLAPELVDQNWKMGVPTVRPGQVMPQTLFQQKLLDNMRDGVIFLDSHLHIFSWNQGAERLSGITAAATTQQIWMPSLVQLRDERGSIVANDECPVAVALTSGVQSLTRMSIAGRNGQDVPIDLHAIPVKGRDGTSYGVTVLMHDVSSESTLEERCQSLHSQATKDPMTQVANRAEFDRVHELFIKAHSETKLPCSLIICDIDHFKNVNDTYGHQAGDEAIRSFASLLKNMCRQGDLVARYGGEEFVMLCADCNNATAAARAEDLRRAFADLPHSEMGGKRITASFGVSENQPGDTPETMLRRADRALLQAKEAGRNKVVQLGTGSGGNEVQARRGWWPFSRRASEHVLEINLITLVPLKVAIEKLRGFVADQSAQIVEANEDRVVLLVEEYQLRRRNDRNVPFVVELKFSTGTRTQSDRPDFASDVVQTRIHVEIRPKRDRDRRLQQVTDRARDLVSSLRSYLMAHEETNS